MIDKLFKPVDDFLNLITTYRLMLYYLVILWLLALVLSLLNLLPFTPIALILNTLLILLTCYISNKFFKFFFKAITNFESTYISALILSLIITPAMSAQNMQFAISAGVISMASKYIFSFNKKHIFNPAAIGIFIPSLFSIGAASWWVGAPFMNIGILLGGILLIRKIQRFGLVLSYIAVYLVAAFLNTLSSNSTPLQLINLFFLNSPFFFFTLVMLTEPSTTPSRRHNQFIYGVVVSILSFFQTLEAALIIGNIFSYIVNPKKKLMLVLKEKTKISPDTYEFIFSKDTEYNYLPGQYLEWTLNLSKIDSRGNRRYFTLSSSPTEKDFKIGIKTYDKPSAFKSTLINLNLGEKVLAGNLSGDFVLPKNSKNLVFVAGGIGITPFRSMIKYLIDIKEPRSIVLFYANKTKDEIVYSDIFNQAQTELGLKVVYTLTDQMKIPANWQGKVGRLNADMISQEVPDFRERIYYLSGPHSMVVGFEGVLKKTGIKRSNIKKDFFPGYA